MSQIAENARQMKVDHLMALMEQRGWPTVDLTTIGSASSLRRHGVAGGSRKKWERLCEWADSRQLNLIIVNALHNPALFHAEEQLT